MTVYEVPINRWSCDKGHFIAEAAVSSEDYLDPGAYYGVSSRVFADCKVCGQVEEPRLVQIGTTRIEVEER